MPSQFKSLLPVYELLSLSSPEGLIICAACKLWESECYCSEFLSLGNPLCPVLDVLKIKNVQVGLVVVSRPLLIENDVLLDGHHRLAAAWATGRKGLTWWLPVEFTSGRLDERIKEIKTKSSLR